MIKRLLPLWVALAALAVFAFILHGLFRARTEQAARVSRLEADNRQLSARADELARRLEAIRGAPVPAPESRPAEPADRRAPIDAVEQATLLIQFREKLASANKSIEALQIRIEELQATVEKAADENKRLSASEADLKEKVAATGRVLTAVQTELQGKDDRLRQLETLNQRLRDDNRAALEKAAQLPRLLRDLEDVNRRRETSLAAILRRYRDLTDQYRALAGRLADDPKQNPLSGSDLSAIQNAIAMTEEDLRQLSSLNAQATRIQQKIGGR
jgi:chromosome segregation ATPase